MSLAPEKIQKLVELVIELADREAASLGTSEKLAGKLRFTQTAVMGRFGRAALRPICELIAKGGDRLSRDFKDCLR